MDDQIIHSFIECFSLIEEQIIGLILKTKKVTEHLSDGRKYFSGIILFQSFSLTYVTLSATTIKLSRASNGQSIRNQ